MSGNANIGGVSRRSTAQAALALGALGVVFGDIGTSPLYAVQTVFNPHDPHPITATRESIFGVMSLIFLVKALRQRRRRPSVPG
jgi:K+ transporter